MADSPEAERFRIAVDLHETGLAIKRQNLRRQHPEASDDQLDEILQVWLEDRPLDYSPT